MSVTRSSTAGFSRNPEIAGLPQWPDPRPDERRATPWCSFCGAGGWRSRLPRRGGSGTVQSDPNVLSWPEKQNAPSGDVDAFARSRIARKPGLPRPRREGAEPPQLHPVAAGKRLDDRAEDGVDDSVRVPRTKVRILLGNLLGKFGSEHGLSGGLWSMFLRYVTSIFRAAIGPSLRMTRSAT